MGRHHASIGFLALWAAEGRTPAELPPAYCGSPLSVARHARCEPPRCGPTACHDAFVLDVRASALRFDGHGAASAGASSRLLYDYPEPQRSQILDYLFLPGFGAALQVLKVEIAGDSQSSYGTEPSHMHHQDDLSCVRGYEFWLLREARRRNPAVVTYALAWAVPYWVGMRRGFQRGYHGSDVLLYLVRWLQCAEAWGVGGIDYIGSQNERPWGTPEWIVDLRAALDEAGFNGTRVVIPDGEYDPSILELAVSNDSFAGALEGGGIGLHYPCYLPRPQVQRAGLKYWSTEDNGVFSDWAGAGCWGRTMNQNFVRMNITSTLSRTMVRAVYSEVPHLQDAFIDAFEPWSGRYMLHPSLWVTAHTTQFTRPGWRILDPMTGSSAYLAKGGSYVTYVSPERDHFTLVVEKLHGECRSCPWQVTSEEDVIFKLAEARAPMLEASAPTLSANSNDSFANASNESPAPDNGSLNGSLLVSNFSSFHNGTQDSAEGANETTTLRFWLTNRTHEFVQLPDLLVDPVTNSFAFTVQPDTIYTVSTTTGQSRGVHGSSADGLYGNSSNLSGQDASRDNATNLTATAPAEQGFPAHFADDFESYALDATPRYFADYGGSWQVALDPTMPGNKILKQWVTIPSGANQWVADTDPIILVGEVFNDYSVSANVYLPGDGGGSNTSRPLRPPASATSAIQSAWSGLCMVVVHNAAWSTAAIRQQDCTPDLNGRLTYHPGTGFIVTGAAKCLTAKECPSSSLSSSLVELCQVDCAEANKDPKGRGFNQAWLWSDDGAIRLRSAPSLCVSAVDLRPSSPLRLLPCEQPAPSVRQRWARPGAALAMYAGVCARLAAPPFAVAGRSTSRKGYCLHAGIDTNGQGLWRLERNGTTVLSQGRLAVPITSWHSLALVMKGPQLTVTVDGQPPVVVLDSVYAQGVTALHSGWGEAYADNFEMHKL